MAQTHDTSPAVVGAIKMAGVLFNTEEPTKAQVRQIRHWIRTGALKVKRMNNILVATEASLREQVTP
jgi:hypothetical protein